MNKRLTKIQPHLLTRVALRFLLPLVLLFCTDTARAAISVTHFTQGYIGDIVGYYVKNTFKRSG